MRSKIKSVFKSRDEALPRVCNNIFLKIKRIFSGKFSMMFLAVAVVTVVGVSVPVSQAQAQFAIYNGLYGLLNLFGGGAGDAITSTVAAEAGKQAMGAIYSITVCLLSLALDVVSWGVYFAAFFIDVMLNPNLYHNPAGAPPGVLDSSAINIGWTTVRDMCNTFFIFFLLLIAFAMILRIQKFGSTKTLLVKFIMAIFLINFSMVIAKIIIDIGQVFMYEIVSWMPSGFQGKAGGLTTIVDQFKDSIGFGWGYGLEDVIKATFAVIYSIMLMLIYFMLAGFLLVRLVMFAILIILSPFAFLSLVLPSMSKYTNEWFDALIKYTIFGPVFLFFIFLSATMANELMGFNYVASAGLSVPGSGEKLTAMIGLMIPHVVALCMLYAVIPVTQKLGGAASQKLIGGTMGMGKIVMGGAAAIKIGGGLGKKSAAWGGRRVGVDAKKVKSWGYGGLEKGADKLSKRGGVVGKVGDRMKGRIVIENAQQAAKDKEAINKEQSGMKQLSKESAETLLKGQYAKKDLISGSVTEKNKIKTAAAAQQYIEKGGDLEKMVKENKGLAAILASSNMDTDDLAKYDPAAAAKIRHTQDSSKSEDEYRKEYIEKHAESGDWKKYNDHMREDHLDEIQEYVDSKDLENHVKHSGKKVKHSYEVGADKAMQDLQLAYTKALADGDATLADQLEEKVQKMREKIRKVTGNLEISDAGRNMNGRRVDDMGSEIGLGEKATTDRFIALNPITLPQAIKVSGGSDFKKLTSESKVIYAQNAQNKGDIAGLRLRDEDSEVLRKMADAVRKSKNKEAIREMDKHEILQNY